MSDDERDEDDALESEFQIPVAFEDLEAKSERSYYVHSKTEVQLLSAGQLSTQLKDVSSALRADPSSLVRHEHFDFLYSCVGAFEKLPPKIKMSLLTLLCESLSSVTDKAISASSRTGGGSVAGLTVHRNAVKMAVFLLASLCSVCEKGARALGRSKPVAGKKAAKKPPKKPVVDDDDEDIEERGEEDEVEVEEDEGKKEKKGAGGEWGWGEHKEKAVVALREVIDRRQLFKLWSMATPEKSFGTLLLQTACNFLENKENFKGGPGGGGGKSLQRSLFKLFTRAATLFTLQQQVAQSVIHLLHNFSHLGEVLAALMWTFAGEPLEKDGESNSNSNGGEKEAEGEGRESQGFVSTVLREIGRMDTSILVRDSTGARSIGCFIEETARALPGVVHHSLSLLLPLMDAESYLLRNGLVRAIGLILEKSIEPQGSGDLGDRGGDQSDKADQAKGSDDEDDEDEDEENEVEPGDDSHSQGGRARTRNRRSREALFAILEERVHDKTSFARGCVIQTWTRLVEARVVPLRLYAKVALIAGDRLRDKACQVRKSAVALFAALLEYNPFGPNLSVNAAKAKLEEKATKFKAELDKRIKQQQQQNPGLALALAEAEAEAEPEKVQDQPAVKQEQDSDDVDDIVEVPEVKGEEVEKGLSEKALMLRELEDSADIQKAKEEMETLLEMVRFVDYIEQHILLLCGLLTSKLKSDILETIRFFVLAHEFQISGAKLGVQRLVILVWSKESGIKEAVMEAYRRLYIGEDLSSIASSRNRSVAYEAHAKNVGRTVATNLCKLVLYGGSTDKGKTGPSLKELTSLEELMSELYRAKHIPPSVVDALWELVSSSQLEPFGKPSKRPGAAGSNFMWDQKNAALSLLTMMAAADKEVILQALSVVVSVGLGPRITVSGGLTLAYNACKALQRLSRDDVSAKVVDTIITKLLSILKATTLPAPQTLPLKQAPSIQVSNPAIVSDARAWYRTAQEAVSVIFALHERPEKVLTTMLKDLAHIALHIDGFAPPRTRSRTASDAHSLKIKDALILGNAELLARFFFLLGHVAVKMLVLLETLEGKIKAYRNARGGKNKPDSTNANVEKDEDDDEDTAGSKKKKGKKGKEGKEEGKASRRSSVKKVPGTMRKRKLIANVDSDDDQGQGEGEEAVMEELAGNAAEEYQLEQFREDSERSLVDLNQDHHNLIGLFGPLVVEVASNPGKFGGSNVGNSAVLCLCKLMCVSPDFCDSHLRLLFTILERSVSSSVRVNVVIAVGDMAVRFPNLVEPWGPRLHHRLSDPHPTVRKHALMVLTHLILNDMQKAKGPIASIAKCLFDSEVPIVDLAKTFFHELARKGKDPVYNILPEVISRLSNDESVSEGAFKEVVRFLLQFINKDKQTEALVEKLCHRFNTPNIAPPIKEPLGIGKDGTDTLIPPPPPTTTTTTTTTETNTTVDMEAKRVIHSRNVAYCLTQLNFTNIGAVKKLAECIRQYYTELVDDEVWAMFNSILVKARKLSAKVENKAVVDDLEERLNSARQKIIGEMASTNPEAFAALIAAQAQASEQQKAGEGGKGGPKRPRAKGKEGQGQGQGKGKGPQKGKKGPPQRKRGRRSDSDEEEEDDSVEELEEDDEEEEEDAPAAKRAKAPVEPASKRGVGGRRGGGGGGGGGRGRGKAAAKPAAAKKGGGARRGRGKKKEDSEDDDESSVEDLSDD